MIKLVEKRKEDPNEEIKLRKIMTAIDVDITRWNRLLCSSVSCEGVVSSLGISERQKSMCKQCLTVLNENPKNDVLRLIKEPTLLLSDIIIIFIHNI